MSDLHRDSLSRVVHRARRFFAPGAASEIWAEFGPKLQNPLLAGSMEVCSLLAVYTLQDM